MRIGHVCAAWHDAPESIEPRPFNQPLATIPVERVGVTLIQRTDLLRRRMPAGRFKRSRHEACVVPVAAQLRVQQRILHRLESVALPEPSGPVDRDQGHAGKTAGGRMTREQRNDHTSRPGALHLRRQREIVDVERRRLWRQCTEQRVQRRRFLVPPRVADDIGDKALLALQHTAARRIEPQAFGKDRIILRIGRMDAGGQRVDGRKVGNRHSPPAVSGGWRVQGHGGRVAWIGPRFRGALSKAGATVFSGRGRA